MNYITVSIPSTLRPLVADQPVLHLYADSVEDAIAYLDRHYPGIKDKLLDGAKPRRWFNLFVGEEDIRFLDGMKTVFKDGDTLDIVQAIAGGAGWASNAVRPGKRRKIERIGFVGALKLITEERYRLMGREVVSPEKPVHQVTRYQTSDPGGCAEFHVTTKTAQRLREALRK